MVRVGWAGGRRGALFTRIQIPKQTPHTAGLTHLALQWFHSITWFLLALSFLLRGLQAGPPVLADVIGLAGLGIYLAFLTAYVLSSRPSSKRGSTRADCS